MNKAALQYLAWIKTGLWYSIGKSDIGSAIIGLVVGPQFAAWGLSTFWKSILGAFAAAVVLRVITAPYRVQAAHEIELDARDRRIRELDSPQRLRLDFENWRDEYLSIRAFWSPLASVEIAGATVIDCQLVITELVPLEANRKGEAYKFQHHVGKSIGPDPEHRDSVRFDIHSGDRVRIEVLQWDMQASCLRIGNPYWESSVTIPFGAYRLGVRLVGKDAIPADMSFIIGMNEKNLVECVLDPTRSAP